MDHEAAVDGGVWVDDGLGVSEWAEGVWKERWGGIGGVGGKDYGQMRL